MRALPISFFFLGACLAPGLSAGLNVKLTPSVPSPAPVGTSVMWKAKASNASGVTTFKFWVTPPGGKPAVVRDWSVASTLPWAALAEGTYRVVVWAADSAGATGQVTATFQLTTRISGSAPVVSPTAHPLVALYSAPPCSSGTVQVWFWPASESHAPMAAPGLPCNGASSLNFYLAGMLPSTAYTIQQVTTTAGKPAPGPQLYFQTGAVNYPLPGCSVVSAVNLDTSLRDRILLVSPKTAMGAPPLYPPFATDLAGNVLWYYWDPESPLSPKDGYLTRPVNGGTLLLLLSAFGIIREADLAGNIVRETNVLRISQQLQARHGEPVTWLSHEARRLPNGHTVTLGSTERVLINTQGSGAVDVLGDVIIDLDENFQVAWSWSSFNFLNTLYPAVLGEKCGPPKDGGSVCGPLKLAPIANDWTHANSLLLTSDGNLLVSLRNLDWVVKIDYRNGTGDGHVIWALGKNGRCALPACSGAAFNLVFDDPWPWFSHQHDVEFDGVNYELYDNANTRAADPPVGLGGSASRGYVFSLDESTMTATVKMAPELGVFSPAFGGAQLLSNGNYQFTSGTVGEGFTSQALEVLPNGTNNFNAVWQTRVYRSFRLKDLYSYPN